MTTNTTGVIPPRFMGLSYEKFAISYAYFHPSNQNLIALFRRLGDGVLRIGGGSVDRVLWTPNSEGATHAQVTPANIEALAGFLQATGWRCLYGVNLATSTPALAAEEVAYAARSPRFESSRHRDRERMRRIWNSGKFLSPETGPFRTSSPAGIRFVRRFFRLCPMSLSPVRLRAVATISPPGHCPSARL